MQKINATGPTNAEVLATDSVSPETKHFCGLLARRKKFWERPTPKSVNWKFGRELAQASRVSVISRNAEPVAMRPDYSAQALRMKWVNSLSDLSRHPTRDEAQKFRAAKVNSQIHFRQGNFLRNAS